MHLAKELTQKSLPEISELGGRDHTNVRHALRYIVWTGTRNDGDQPGAKIGDIDVEQYLHDNRASTNSSCVRCGIRSTCC